MSKGRTLSQLISAGAILADGQISAGEIVGMVSVLKVTATTYPGNDLAANPSGGQTITLTGSNFTSTPIVYVGDTIAPSVTFVSSTQLTFIAPAKTAGTYSVYVVNPDGTTAILVNGISYSGTPAWTSAAGNLGTVDANFTIQLQATGDAPVTYSLTTGSTLPSGVTLSSSGLITGTAIGSDQTFSFSVDAIDAQLQETPRSFQVTVSLADPFFRYVTLLLQADPVVTPFNSDASTNAFNVAINGDTRSDNFTPYQGNGYYSIAMDGTGDYLTTPTTADFNLTGDFTLECWVNVATTAAGNVLFSVGAPISVYHYVVNVNTNNTVSWSLNSSATWNISHTYTTTDAVPINTWTHLAFVRSGNNFTIYFNGVSKYTTASYTQPSTASGTFYLGTYFADANNDGSYFRGNISNFRILKGTALYTAAFTPPTAPLTAITNTKLLVAQSNRFVDNSTNNAAITRVGDTKVSPAQPFTNPTDISTYGSGHFDGSGDYLTLSAGSAFAFGTADFTVECFVYIKSFPSNPNSVYFVDSRNSGQLSTWLFGTSADGTNSARFDWYTGSAMIAGSVLPLNAWLHLVFTRASSTYGMFVNGVRVATGTDSTNYSTAPTTSYIASRFSADNQLNGYMSNLRIVKGTAVYNPTLSTLTIPTAPLTAITNTQLLLLQYNGGGNNSGFEDSSQFNWPVTRAGNTTQGTFTPYGSNWSTYFTGSSYLTIPTTTALSFGTGDFTIEGWVYKTVAANASFVDGRVNPGTASPWGFFVDGSNFPYFYDATVYTSSVAVILNAWTHIAAVRTSGTLKIFVNGVQGYSAALSTNLDRTAGAFIGVAANSSGPSAYWQGYMSNLRIVKGTAVYTAAFTPSTTPLTAISGTSLLTFQSNRFIDNSSNAFTFTIVGSPSIQRFSPFSPTTAYDASVIGGSAYLDGSGDYLTVPYNPALVPGNNDFTVELWVYFNDVGSTLRSLCGLGYGANGSGPVTSTWHLRYMGSQGSNQLMFARYDGSTEYNYSTSGATFVNNSWYHIAVSKASGTLKIFVNGVAYYSAANSINYTAINTSDPFVAGVGYFGPESGMTGPRYFNGILSNIRVINGTGLYTANFTPPTAPLTPVAKTTLLLSNTNAGIYDGAMMNDLETVGNAMVSTSVKKYGTGSLYFNPLSASAANYLVLPSSELGSFGTVNFTIEFWMYPTSLDTSHGTSSLATLFDTDVSAGSGTDWWAIHQSGSGLVLASNSTNQLTSNTGILTANTWQHVAFVRNGTALTVYVNGTAQGSVTYATTLGSKRKLFIGVQSGVARWYKGYLDDVRITKGVARYTTNFTAPALAMKAK